MLKVIIALISSLVVLSPVFAYASPVEISDGSVIGLYHFDGDSVDSSGNGRNGTDSNITYSNSCLIDGLDCAVFNGSDAKIVTTAYPLNGTSSLTVAYWQSIDSLPSAYDRILSYPATDEFIMGITNANKVRWFLNSSDYGQGDQQTGWHFIVERLGSGVKDIYIDGSFIASTSQSHTFSATGTLMIGSQGASEWFTGKLQEMVILNRVMSEDEITSIYNSGAGNYVCVDVGCGTPTSTPSSTPVTTSTYSEVCVVDGSTTTCNSPLKTQTGMLLSTFTFLLSAFVMYKFLT